MRRPPFPVRLFTVDEYHRLIRSGMLTEEDRVELLDGWITPKMTHSPMHDAVVDLVAEAINRKLPKGWRTRVQSATTTSTSEPEPDVAVIRGAARDYLLKHPGPDETGLIVEIADTSLRIDRTLKLRIYANAAIAVYWIVNLPDRQIEVFMNPAVTGRQATYSDQEVYRSGDSIPLVLDGRRVATLAAVDLLP
jgi:Uma2 family endonuclease